MPGEAKCLCGEQGAHISPYTPWYGLPSPAWHGSGYTPRLGVSHRANTILEVVLPFIDIGGEATVEDEI